VDEDAERAATPARVTRDDDLRALVGRSVREAQVALTRASAASDLLAAGNRAVADLPALGAKIEDVRLGCADILDLLHGDGSR
jgi:hypothetical protein